MPSFENQKLKTFDNKYWGQEMLVHLRIEGSEQRLAGVHCRVQEKNNCPLRCYLGLNLSMRLRKSNFDYFATKCYGQLSIQWTIVHTMSISWTIVHEMDNCYTIVHIVGNVHS